MNEFVSLLIVMIAAVGMGIGAMRNMRIAILALLALLPTYLVRLHIGALPITLLEVLLVALVGVWLVRFIGMSPSKRVGYYATLGTLPLLLAIGMMLLFMGATIGVFISPNFVAALGIWKAYIVEPLLFALIFFLEMREWEWIKKTGRVLVLMGGGLATLGIAQFVTGIGLIAPWDGISEPVRITSLYPYPNALSLLLVPIIAYAAMALLAGIGGSFFDKYVYAVACLLMALALFLTKSEGGIAACAVAIFAVGLWHTKRTRKILMLLAALFVGMSLVIAPIRESLIAILSFRDVSTDVRLVLWQGAWRLVMAHPFVGAGLAGFPDVYALYKEAKHVELLLYPHNIFLNFWVETGVLGMVGAIFSLCAAFVASASLVATESARKNPIAMGSVAALVALVLHGLVDVPFFKNDLAMLWWVVLLLPVLCAKLLTYQKK